MYPGLTTADNGTLLDAKAKGAEWIARDEIGMICGYATKPSKYNKTGEWYTDDGFELITKFLKFVKWSDTEPVNIDLAIAQIAEMESTEMESVEKPMTVNEWINQASVEEKAKWLSERGYCPENFFDCSMHEDCKACWKVVLNSPYTEGATK